MATVTGFTAEKILEMFEGLKVGTEVIDGINQDLGDLGTALADNQALLDHLNDVVLPQLQEDLAANQILLDNLNDNTLQQLQADLDANQVELAQLNGLFPITETSIADDAITTPKLVSNLILAEHIVADQINANHIVANSIGADEIAANSIYADDIVANQINAGHIVSNAISSDKIAANSIYADHIVTNQINADHIVSNAIQAGHIQAGAIDGIVITGATIQTSSFFGSARLIFNSTGLRGYPGSSSVAHSVIGTDGNASFKEIFISNGLSVLNSGTSISTNGDIISGGNVFVNGVATNTNATVGNDLRILGTNGLVKINSSARYKKNIRPANFDLNAIYQLTSSEYESRETGETGYGFIADQAHALGLTMFVSYDEEGRPDSFSYPGYVLGLQTAVLDLNNRVKELERLAWPTKLP